MVTKSRTPNAPSISPPASDAGIWRAAARLVGLVAFGALVIVLVAVAAVAVIGLTIAAAVALLALRWRRGRRGPRATGPALLEARRAAEGWVAEATPGAAR